VKRVSFHLIIIFSCFETSNIFSTPSEDFLHCLFPQFFLKYVVTKQKNDSILFWLLFLGLRCVVSSRTHPICRAYMEAWQGLSPPALHEFRVGTD